MKTLPRLITLLLLLCLALPTLADTINVTYNITGMT